MSILLHTGFTLPSLQKRVQEAHHFHQHFLQHAQSDQGMLQIRRMPEWASKFLRRSASRPQALLDKLGSNSLAKRRPTHLEPFLAYIEKRTDAEACLQLRLVVGPVKNVQRSGANQQPDLAEYLMFLQLARVMEAIAPLYPYGIAVQLVPDDLRGHVANGWPAAYGEQYIAGLKQMVKQLQFDGWLTVEDGQAKLYAQYEVETFIEPARQAIMHDPHHAQHVTSATRKAEQNVIAHGATAPSPTAVRESALRYLIHHQAEILSGMWSPTDALPLIYAQHPNHYQLYTMGTGVTKLPWQISLPFTVLEVEDRRMLDAIDAGMARSAV